MSTVKAMWRSLREPQEGGAVSGGGQYGEELGAGRRDGAAAGRQTAGPHSGAASGRAGMRGAAAIGAADNAATLAEYGAAGGADCDQRSPAGTLCYPQAAGLAAQKKTLRAREQRRADVAAERAAPCSLPGASFAERVKSIAPEDLVFVDEI